MQANENNAVNPENEHQEEVNSTPSENTANSNPVNDETSNDAEEVSTEQVNELIQSSGGESDDMIKEDEDDEEDKKVVFEEEDYTGLSEQELRSKMVSLTEDPNSFANYRNIEKLKSTLDAIVEEQKSNALAAFVAENGNQEGFEYKLDNDTLQCFKLYKAYAENRKKIRVQQELQSEDNLNKKLSLLDEIRAFVDSETTSTSLKQIREFQNQWKSIGPAPLARRNEIWSSYKALLSRYYNNRSFLMQLKDLDKEKNLKAKIAVCEKAEALGSNESINHALSLLNELHQQYKDIGAVPEDQHEALWNRFKAASDVLYEKKKNHVVEFKKQLDENLVKKNELIGQIEELTKFDSEDLSLWKEKTNEVLKLQETWKTIGPIPKSVSKEISKKFWSSCKQFFKNKGAHMSKQDQEREKNYEAKVELCVKVEGYLEQDAEELRTLVNDVKALQRKWKEVGPAPRKKSEEVYQRFKKACDQFFDSLRNKRKEEDAEFDNNYKAKVELIEKFAKEKASTEESLRSFISEFESLGFVPRNKKESITKKYNEVVDTCLSKIEGLDDYDKEVLLLEGEVALARNSPNPEKALSKKISEIRGKINSLNDEITTLQTNIEFFANSKNADGLRADIDKKIDVANQKIAKLKTQLSILRNV